MSASKTQRRVRAFVDYFGPLCFLAGFLITRDVVQATAALVAGSAVALVVGFVVEKRIAPMPLVAGGAALLFGGLTLVFKDPRFIYVKPTVINLGFAAFLLGGMALKRNPLKALLGEAFRLPDHAWRTLTLRYGIFFVCVAILNEIVWRTQPEAVWVAFRFPGLQILALVFSFTQIPLMMKHHEDEPAPPPTE
ncbi:inner membrane-spanning protein YciB [Phenylobacterium sp.]|jgi:intracellular septation protein|uniref:inner membrane-spanning protein YciB n=1 Tax=Phenylobacterium sp. TaxID=1871053 RepID=UPI002E3356D9|nr:inner membrane-spanning protein YciB [Phenylobacterium sp.]HEX2558630.1 inner membrane-spanning protein YciB [Phenylobacterium sp.]